MNANTQKLVDALRSGEFTQGYGHLASHNGAYCCLGVACELYRRETNNGRWWSASDSGPPTFVWCNETSDETGEFEGYYLPRPVQNWLGWQTAHGAWSKKGENLAILNDDGHSFEEIADAIEEHYDDMIVPATEPAHVAISEG